MRSEKRFTNVGVKGLVCEGPVLREGGGLAVPAGDGQVGQDAGQGLPAQPSQVHPLLLLIVELCFFVFWKIKHRLPVTNQSVNP